jgi:hypothetical protein
MAEFIQLIKPTPGTSGYYLCNQKQRYSLVDGSFPTTRVKQLNFINDLHKIGLTEDTLLTEDICYVVPYDNNKNWGEAS